MQTLEYADERVISGLVKGEPTAEFRKQLERIGADETASAAEIFDELLTMLGGNIKMAEREMMRMLRIPPHWRDEKLCDQCGPVMVEDAANDCPWCES